MSCSNTTAALISKVLFGLLALSTLASLYNVYVAHFAGVSTFGDSAASLSLIAFPLNVAAWWYVGKDCGQCSK